MSGIFGFTMNTDRKELLEEALGGLEYWNRIYGTAPWWDVPVWDVMWSIFRTVSPAVRRSCI